jgi:hypothetical protein
MRLRRIEKFTKAVTKGLLHTQQATVSQVVCGLLTCRCLIFAVLSDPSGARFPLIKSSEGD